MSRVLLVGWDAADWKVADPLLAAGEMPNLKSLIDSGVRGNIATLQPAISPMLWTSIATGKRPPGHGIHGFYEPTPDGMGVQPVTSLGRKTKAIWNILNQNGKRSVVAGWWPSHPAEPIRGAMVSNHFAPPPIDSEAPVPPGSIWPPAWADRLRGLRVHGAGVGDETLRGFAPDLDRVDRTRDSTVRDLANVIAESMSVHRAATALMESEPWDFAAIYYVGIDHFSHRFMRYHAGRIVADRVPHDPEVFRDVVRNAYRWHDEMLGDLLRLAGKECAVLLVSDHGFHSDGLLPDYIPPDCAGPAVEHRNFGIFCMRAPGLRRGHRITRACILDVAPTILHLFGLPIGRDMDGKVLIDAFENDRMESPIPGWDDVAGEDGRHDSRLRYDGAEAAESLKHLVALGYVAPPGDDERRNVEDCVTENQYNLARALMDAGRMNEAAAIFRALVGKKPHQGRFYIHLFRCLALLDDQPGMERLADQFDAACAEFVPWAEKELSERRAVRPDDDLQGGEIRDVREIYERKQLNEIAGGFKRKRLAMRCQLEVARAKRSGRKTDARALLDELASQIRGQRGSDLFLAKTFAVLGDEERALEFASRARASDPDTWEVMTLEAQIYCKAGRHEECVASATQSLSLVDFQPRLHYVMGLSLRSLGDYRRAAHEFSTALSQMPVLAAARAELDKIAERTPDAVAPGSPRIPEARGLPETSAEAGFVAPHGFTTSAGAAPEDRSRIVTVVTGLPRSGTSMMMQMLAAGGIAPFTDGKRVPDEDNPRGYYECEEATSLHRDVGWIPQARGKAVKIVAQLLPYLPAGEAYRIVFMQRALEEVVASQRAMLERTGRVGGELLDWQLIRAYSQQLVRIRTWLAGQPGIQVLHVNYADAANEPFELSERLARFLGNPFDRTRAANAVDASMRRQRLHE